MPEDEGKSVVTRQTIRAEIEGQFPELVARRDAKKKRVPAVIDRFAIVLGLNQDGKRVLVGEEPRLRHTHVIGTTGGGKTKFLEHCIRQDILLGRGVCVVDPHGNHPESLYRSLLAWLEETGISKSRTIHLVDPNASTHTVGFNPLERYAPNVDLSVIAAAALEAFERIWGDEDTNAKPTIQRNLPAIFATLAELGLTLAEAEFLFDPHDEHGVRADAIGRVKTRFALNELKWIDRIARERGGERDFRAEVLGSRNRIEKLVRAKAIRTMVGQTEHTLDLRAALDEGHIILANLSGGDLAHDTETEMLGRLLTRFLFFHAKRRKNPKRLFFVYLDECQRYLSGDIPNILAEVRKYGVGAVLSHQWQAQLGTDEDETLAAVRNATNLKVVFQIKDHKEAEDLALAVIPLNLEMPVAALIKPTVVDHEIKTFRGAAVGKHHATSSMMAESTTFGDASVVGNMSVSGGGAGQGQSETLGTAQGWLATSNLLATTMAQSASESWVESDSSSKMSSYSKSTTEAYGEAHGTSQQESWSEGLRPVMNPLPTAVHSKENVLHMAAKMLRDLKPGQAFANYVGNNGMEAAMLFVPPVKAPTVSDEEFAELRRRIFERSPSAIDAATAAERVAERERSVIAMGKEARKAPPKPQVPEPEEPTIWRVAAPKRKPKPGHRAQ